MIHCDRGNPGQPACPDAPRRQHPTNLQRKPKSYDDRHDNEFKGVVGTGRVHTWAVGGFPYGGASAYDLEHYKQPGKRYTTGI